MDINTCIPYLTLLLAIGGLVIVTNIIVEVLKQITWKHTTFWL